MTFWIFMAALLMVPMPQLAVIGLLASVPMAFLLAISAWHDYTSPVPLADALYLKPMFWVVEGVGALVLCWLILIAIDKLTRD